jgi:purine-binding chemotaxis protein CheW
MHAQAHTPAETELDSRQYITFAVESDEYGIDIISVREIKAWTPATTLPNSPTFMRGVINLRGSIVPIYDLRALFGKGTTETSKNHVVIIVAAESRVLGILVDAVSDIVSLQNSQIQAPPSTRDQGKHYVEGLTQVGERMIMLLDPKTLIKLEQLDEQGMGDMQPSMIGDGHTGHTVMGQGAGA